MNITKPQLKQIIKEEINLLEAEGSADQLIKTLVAILRDMRAGQKPNAAESASAESGLTGLARGDGDLADHARSILELWPDLYKDDSSTKDFLGQRVGYLYTALKRAQ